MVQNPLKKPKFGVKVSQISSYTLKKQQENCYDQLEVI